MKKQMKLLLFAAPLLVAPAIALTISSDVVDTTSYSTKFNPNSVKDSFEYTAYQSIQAGKKENEAGENNMP
jgi:hypothetical protein